MMAKRRTCRWVVFPALMAGCCACTTPILWAGSDPASEGKVVTSDPIQSPDRADRPAVSTSQTPEPETVKPAQGTACIVDSSGRVTRFSFETASAPFDWEGWRARVEEFEQRRSAARAENERLRLQWIAEERERAREEAARNSAAQTEPRRQESGQYGWILGGTPGGRPWQGPGGRPRPPRETASKPRPDRPEPIFLPAPNLTSPFPHSSTRDPKSTHRSFLP